VVATSMTPLGKNRRSSTDAPATHVFRVVSTRLPRPCYSPQSMRLSAYGSISASAAVYTHMAARPLSRSWLFRFARKPPTTRDDTATKCIEHITDLESIGAGGAGSAHSRNWRAVGIRTTALSPRWCSDSARTPQAATAAWRPRRKHGRPRRQWRFLCTKPVKGSGLVGLGA